MPEDEYLRVDFAVPYDEAFPRPGRPLGGQPPELPPTPLGELARRVRLHRVQRGWSQSQLAAAMSRLGHPWHQTTVAKTERGEREPRFSELLELANALDVPVEVLLGRPSPLVSDPVAELRDNYRGLEQERRLAGLRLQQIERDLEQLTSQRDEALARVVQLDALVIEARDAYTAARNR